jgi:hypothetical protein
MSVESKLLEALQESSCFGIAHDENVPECKQCDVRGQCKSKSEGESIATPKSKPKQNVSQSKVETKDTKKPTNTKPTKSSTTAKKLDKPSTKPKAQTKPKTTHRPGVLPNFKSMSLEELKALAVERNVEWKEYGNDNITRMRLIMNLKASY